MGLSVAIEMEGGSKPAKEMDSYEAACDELADILKVPEDKREEFCECLQKFVELCHEGAEY